MIDDGATELYSWIESDSWDDVLEYMGTSPRASLLLSLFERRLKKHTRATIMPRSNKQPSTPPTMPPISAASFVGGETTLFESTIAVVVELINALLGSDAAVGDVETPVGKVKIDGEADIDVDVVGRVVVVVVVVVGHVALAGAH